MTSPSDAALLAVVVVHYGDPAATRRCLDSLAGLDEVILVDQPPVRFGSHPRVTRRIEPDSNIGFAAACNRAVETTEAQFVLLLNNDAVLVPDAASQILAALPALAPDVAGACLKLLGMDGETLQSAGGLWFTRDGIGFPHGFGETDRGQYDSLDDAQIGVPSGAAAIYRTCAWREVGGMAEEFFCYCEDGDLGLRMIAAGSRFAWLPRVRVLHELSSSSGPHSLQKAWYVERNHFAAMVRMAPASLVAALPPWTLVRLARATFDAVTNRGAAAAMQREAGMLQLAGTLVSAWIAAARMLPSAARFRRDLAARQPLAGERVHRFLVMRRVPLARFARTRDA